VSQLHRGDLLESIANTIADYRKGEVPPRTPEVVDRWVSQFGEDVQEPILAEMDRVLKRTYISESMMRDVLLALATNSGLTGPDPYVYWKNANFLNIESRGNSQRVMLAMFGQILNQKFNVNFDNCGSDTGPYFYLDDIVFTGSHFKGDLIRWLKSDGPPEMRIIVVVIAYHSQGQFFASKDVVKAAEKANKHAKITWCRRLVV